MNIFKWIFWRYLRVIFANIPIKLTMPVISAISFFYLIFGNRMRRVTLSELTLSGLIKKDDKTYYLLYRAIKNHINSVIKLFYLPRINSGNIGKYIQIDGLHRLDEAINNGKGVILLNPHFGPFMLIMPALGHRGYKLNQVALQGIGRRKGLDRIVYEIKLKSVEGNMPVNFINATYNKMAVRDVLCALKRNEVVLFASTGRGGTSVESSWRTVNFLGRKANFNLSFFKIALRAGSTLLPVFVIDSEPFAKVIIEKPLETLKEGIPEKVLIEYISVLERYVKRYPDHFAFFLYEMNVKRLWDDHPFFLDYPVAEEKFVNKMYKKRVK